MQQLNAVVWAVCRLFRRPANQITVLQAMCRWVYVADRTEGLRTIPLSVGLQLVGIEPDPDFDFPPAEADRPTVRRLTVALFWHVLRDEGRIRRLFRLVRLLDGRPWWTVVAGWAHGSRRADQAAGS
ncbi:hypothetical protein [Kutzneria kofuensis]|uniref:Uncharacterized protein n=1 Tax=Kutzneria kofuensis TaxID=103725 RepID=A0A7W9KT91_9PSEU|nr:hypothetical protein [Kutzneria kofuensis]MBB5897529.1 hypothetical protein [Kutzneria kofuensis]